MTQEQVSLSGRVHAPDNGTSRRAALAAEVMRFTIFCNEQPASTCALRDFSSNVRNLQPSPTFSGDRECRPVPRNAATLSPRRPFSSARFCHHAGTRPSTAHTAKRSARTCSRPNQRRVLASHWIEVSGMAEGIYRPSRKKPGRVFGFSEVHSRKSREGEPVCSRRRVQVVFMLERMAGEGLALARYLSG